MIDQLMYLSYVEVLVGYRELLFVKHYPAIFILANILWYGSITMTLPFQDQWFATGLNFIQTNKRSGQEDFF